MALTQRQQTRLRQFAREMIRASGDGYDVDGGDIQDLAEGLGLIKRVSFNPRRHNDGGLGLERGDDFFEFADFLKYGNRLKSWGR